MPVQLWERVIRGGLQGSEYLLMRFESCSRFCGTLAAHALYFFQIHRVTSQVVAVKVMESDKWALQEASVSLFILPSIIFSGAATIHYSLYFPAP